MHCKQETAFSKKQANAAPVLGNNNNNICLIKLVCLFLC